MDDEEICVRGGNEVKGESENMSFGNVRWLCEDGKEEREKERLGAIF